MSKFIVLGDLCVRVEAVESFERRVRQPWPCNPFVNSVAVRDALPGMGLEGHDES